jgi:hypothetical protein
MKDRNLSENVGFWRRQFFTEISPHQNAFDWTFGILVPVTCILIDPIVFRSFLGEAMLGDIKPFIFILSFANIVGLIGWLLQRSLFNGISAALAGLFFVSGLVACFTAICVVVFCADDPIMLLLGGFGYLPLWLAAFVYFRNALRAIKQSTSFLAMKTLVPLLVLSSMVSFVLPFVANLKANLAIDKIVTGTPREIYATADQIRIFAPVMSFDRVARKYCDRNIDMDRRKALASVYYQFTGLRTGGIRFQFCGESMVVDEEF